MLCIFYSDTETWKGNFIFVEKPRCSCLQHQRNKWWAFLPSQAVPLTPQNTPKLSGITTEVISSIFHSKTLTGLYIGDINAGLILTERETKISKTHIYDWYSATQKPTNTKKQTKKNPPKPLKPRPPQKTPNQPTKNQIKKEPTKKIHLHGCLLDLLFALEKLLARKIALAWPHKIAHEIILLASSFDKEIARRYFATRIPHTQTFSMG